VKALWVKHRLLSIFDINNDPPKKVKQSGNLCLGKRSFSKPNFKVQGVYHGISHKKILPNKFIFSLYNFCFSLERNGNESQLFRRLKPPALLEIPFGVIFANQNS
jgi:hypothetical protein